MLVHISDLRKVCVFYLQDELARNKALKLGSLSSPWRNYRCGSSSSSCHLAYRVHGLSRRALLIRRVARGDAGRIFSLSKRSCPKIKFVLMLSRSPVLYRALLDKDFYVVVNPFREFFDSARTRFVMILRHCHLVGYSHAPRMHPAVWGYFSLLLCTG